MAKTVWLHLKGDESEEVYYNAEVSQADEASPIVVTEAGSGELLAMVDPKAVYCLTTREEKAKPSQEQTS